MLSPDAVLIVGPDLTIQTSWLNTWLHVTSRLIHGNSCLLYKSQKERMFCDVFDCYLLMLLNQSTESIRKIHWALKGLIVVISNIHHSHVSSSVELSSPGALLKADWVSADKPALHMHHHCKHLTIPKGHLHQSYIWMEFRNFETTDIKNQSTQQLFERGNKEYSRWYHWSRQTWLALWYR